jgi:hypothetical protein
MKAADQSCLKSDGADGLESAVAGHRARRSIVHPWCWSRATCGCGATRSPPAPTSAPRQRGPCWRMTADSHRARPRAPPCAAAWRLRPLGTAPLGRSAQGAGLSSRRRRPPAPSCPSATGRLRCSGAAASATRWRDRRCRSRRQVPCRIRPVAQHAWVVAAHCDTLCVKVFLRARLWCMSPVCWHDT